jgi:hypothetical protein
MDEHYWTVKSMMEDVETFCELGAGLKLRRYQRQVAQSIVKSVMQGLGMTFVVIFPRQSGKNELQAHIETYLLTLLQREEVELVKVSPTWKPQSLNAMRRLESVLKRGMLSQGRWKKEWGYIYRLDKARIFFLSGSPTTNVVGATANLLLQCDEAQDVQIAKWDKDFAPMAASTNATRVFWGTVWTSKTLLARETHAALAAEKRDGKRRVFIMSANEVGEEVPEYRQYVEEQVQKLGRNHPLIKTQYYSEEIDSEGGMFPDERQVLMRGKHARLTDPLAGEVYAMLIDVAGEDEGASDELDLGESLRNLGRDSTAVTMVRINTATIGDELIRAPSYEVVNRYLWTGTKHTNLYSLIKALAELWSVRWLVIDATGVGAGMASFLGKALPGKVLPFLFSGKSKSELGWNFMAVIETGRYKEYACQEGEKDLQELFWKQVQHCQSSVDTVPGRMIRWGFPDGSRDTLTGELLHDDLLISAALCAELDKQQWEVAESGVIHSIDPLQGLDRVY